MNVILSPGEIAINTIGPYYVEYFTSIIGKPMFAGLGFDANPLWNIRRSIDNGMVHARNLKDWHRRRT